jgi:type VI secretion system protein ImpE
MTAEEAIKAGRPDEALTALQDAVRKAPADPRLRRFLFQLHCVLGKWDKALTQLQVLADMDAESMLLANIFQPVIQCELLRSEVFAGKRSPIIFGEPEQWIGQMVQANQLFARDEVQAARDMQAQALEEAPPTSGRLNDQPFEWFADADSRLGPLLEALVDGRYCWVPFTRIQRLAVEPPRDLRDLVWTPAQFVWTNGGEASGFIPTRYAGTEAATDGGLRLSRRTEWVEKGEEFFVGLGQRIFATDQADVPLLEVRTIEFDNAPVSAAAPTMAS